MLLDVPSIPPDASSGTAVGPFLLLAVVALAVLGFALWRYFRHRP